MASGETQHEPPSNNANNAPTTSALNHANRPSTTGHTVVDPALILRFGAKQIIRYDIFYFVVIHIRLGWA